jgi:ferrous iron transport protein A
MMTLIEMQRGERARIVEFLGGSVQRRRLENLGLHQGKVIEKISVNPFRGPLVVRVDQVELAIGYGMASRIKVELL